MVVLWEPVRGRSETLWLNQWERERAACFVHEADREAYVAAHRLVRISAGLFLGCSPADLDIGRWCSQSGNDVGHGRPVILGYPDVHLSLSHSRGYVAAMAHALPCGIDVEGLAGAPTVPDRALTMMERQWLVKHGVGEAMRLWVRKEALVKAGLARLDDVGCLCVVAEGEELASEVEGYCLEGWEMPGAVGAWAVAGATSDRSSSRTGRCLT